jgi:hypothetical protein
MMTVLTKTSNDGVKQALYEADTWIRERRKQARESRGRFSWWGKVQKSLNVAVCMNIVWRMIA